MKHLRTAAGILLVCLMLGLGYWGLQKNIFTSKAAIEKTQPVMAIVIDDFGGADTHGVKEFMAMDIPITMAVMPNLSHSVEQSREAHQRGHEVILHQPMEPVKGKASWLGPGAIVSNMSDKEIKATFTKNLQTVPYAKGFNNHTGSRITSNKEKIIPMLEVAQNRGLYVLDSLTSVNSQVIPAAKSMNIPCVKRDIFLDDVKSKDHIQKQLSKACKVAKKQGFAVVIGHVGQGGNITAEAIKEAIPSIQKEGIKLVPLSEIVKLNTGNEKI
ncbi:divergent polysaccharide deacetylase family protein [Desulforamulus ruminis]|uniref:Divergent polysaccharide deacetylase n=1 Tax=Desulforamulus ruminis (strain ATCC 23193 / DSM 2154 / NCIMB 8452 / DL) TaxID=696281 RepID=F6DVI9_DESRL|nr:divergent polysaccharide deacetylase family protein [Desulforamulus ruminis]AEG61449.1 protein of unknown function DUF610 YibQ [Desulforamulus ruminis DSM 2154]